jgi:hypothetical protein
MYFLVFSDIAMERLKLLLMHSPHFEPAEGKPIAECDETDQEIVNDIRLAIKVPGTEPVAFREKLSRGVNVPG